MKLSTKGRYGLRAMYELSLSYKDNKPVPIKIIAQKTKFSEQYLEQIFATLKKSDLIVSIRGAQGGYLLAKPPSQISVGNIIRCLDGPVEPAVCVSENYSQLCVEENCVTKLVWRKLKDSIDNCLDSISLQDMIDNNIDKGKASENLFR